MGPMVWKRVPLHVLWFAIYPVLQLLAVNILETRLTDAVRPLLVSLAAALLVFAVLSLILRNVQRAGMVATFLLVLFFSYGHVYGFVRQESLLGAGFGHRYLLPIYAALFAAGMWLLIWKLKDLLPLTGVLNLIGAFLLIYPLYQVVTRADFTSEQAEQRARIATLGQELRPDPGQPLPDVYVFLIDTYIRADYLQSDFAYDNSPFLDQLRLLGFYIADCSRGNYYGTRRAVANLLNFDYISGLKAGLASLGYDPEKEIWTLIPNSILRSQLEQLGYQTVAYENPDFPWLLFSDAEHYYARPEVFATTGFENLLLETSAFRVVFSIEDRLGSSTEEMAVSITPPYQRRYQNDMDTFAWLEETVRIPGPKFVYAHLLPLHQPFTHAPDCSLLTDSNYYSLEGYKPVNEQYFRDGYVSSLECTNAKMLALVTEILQNSDTPPVIVIMGDHGIENTRNATSILNAYYLPGGSEGLYPTISPVNSFRVILNRTFGTDYSLLDDIHYPAKEETNPTEETSPACLTP